MDLIIAINLKWFLCIIYNFEVYSDLDLGLEMTHENNERIGKNEHALVKNQFEWKNSW